MAKTLFANGTVVLSTFLNTIFRGASATGSRHDGQDVDGHLPKINLSADAGAVKQEVTGTLPLANMATHTHNGTDAHIIGPEHSSLPYRGYIDGFQMFTIVGAVGEHRVWIGPGEAMNSTNAARLRTTVQIGKQIVNGAHTGGVEWTAGEEGGGVATDVVIGEGWYHVFAIRKPGDGTVDFCIDSDIAASHVLASGAGKYPGVDGYTQVRRIGSIYIEGGSGTYKVRPFTQYGDRVLWTTNGYLSATATHTASGKSDLTMAVPTGLQVRALFRAVGIMDDTNFDEGCNVLIHSPDCDDDYGTALAEPGCTLFLPGIAGISSSVESSVITDDESKARLSVLFAGVGTVSMSLSVTCYGYIDLRGRQ